MINVQLLVFLLIAAAKKYSSVYRNEIPPQQVRPIYDFEPKLIIKTTIRFKGGFGQTG